MRAFDVRTLGDVVFESDRVTPADVAIVIPLYNYEMYVVECLQSVVAQTLDGASFFRLR